MMFARYFAFVGAALLALLFISDACFPKLPMLESSATDRSIIRIHSARKWPEPVVFDTSMTAAAAHLAEADKPAGGPAPVVAETAAPVKTGAREAFAQLPAAEPKQIELTDPQKLQPKPQQKRKVAKRRVGPPMVLVAQQPQVGFFGNNTW